MNILALDTCTEMCSAALYYQGKIYTRSQMTRNRHSDLIMGMMDELFKEAGITIAEVEVVAFGRGPGSFTGIRIGVGVAQGIAFARDIPVIPISSLTAVAQGAAEHYQEEYIAVTMDARMGEIYCASYRNENGRISLLDEERVCLPENYVPCMPQQWLGVGTGWAEYPSVLENNFSGNLAQVNAKQYPCADSIIKLAQEEIEQGNLLPAEQAMPVYLRDNVAKKKVDQ